MCTTIYYPRIKKITFYGDNGVMTGWMSGGIAKEKFFRLLKQGRMPRISLSKNSCLVLKRNSK